VAVPAQDRDRGDRGDPEDFSPPAAVNQPGQRRQPEPVEVIALWSVTHLPTQHQEFDLLG
jgi:hypothetical protein